MLAMTRFAARAAVVVALAAAAAPGQAQTLRDTLVQAYRTSPVLEAQRAVLAATNEGIAQVRARRRPQVEGSATAALSDSSVGDSRDSYSVGIDASLLLYDHGRTAAALNAAEAQVGASLADLRAVEQNVLLDAATAFLDIRRDAQLVSLSQSNVDVLGQQVRATQDRFEVGEVTLTDVSLAQARQAAARSTLAASEGQLRLSRDRYQAVVGVPPGALAPPPPAPLMPGTLADAEAISMREHPALAAARLRELAASHDLERARRDFGPSAGVNGSVQYGIGQGQLDQDVLSAQVGLQATIPIYSGGQLESATRQAEAVLAQRKAQLQSTARSVRQGVAAAWSNIAVAKASITASRQQVEAAEIAVSGVREEASLGARTTLDVLDREQELRDAQFSLVSAQRDEYVAAFSLLSAMGLLSVTHLNLGIAPYDPGMVVSESGKNPPTAAGVNGFDGSVVDRISDRWGKN